MMMFNLPVVRKPGVIFAPLLGVSALAIVAMAPTSVLAVVLASGFAGALAVLGARLSAGLAGAALLLWGLARVMSDFVPFVWIAGLAFGVAALMPARPPMILISSGPNFWAGVLGVGAASLVLALAVVGPLAWVAGALAGAAALALGFALARRIVLPEARVVAGGADSLASLARDLLLGRIASGMLHDLSQPLNVISMANGNMGYIIERLDLDGERREQLIERTRRIAVHTDRAAQVLGLFRWFGRDGSRDQGLMTIGSALNRAVAATRSDLRHGGVTIEVGGDALDYPVLLRHGTVEMLTVAALLSAFNAFAQGEKGQSAGSILLEARQAAGDILVILTCADEAGQPCATGDIDREMLWLVSEAARERGGDYRRISRRNQPLCIVIRFSRETI